MCSNSIPIQEYRNRIGRCFEFDTIFKGFFFKLAEPGEVMEFYNFNNQLQRPFVVFADFECFFATKPDEPGKLQKHEPTSAAFYFVNTCKRSKNQTWSYVGKDCVSKLLIELSNWLKNASRRYRKAQDMNITIKSKFKLEKGDLLLSL